MIDTLRDEGSQRCHDREWTEVHRVRMLSPGARFVDKRLTDVEHDSIQINCSQGSF